MVKPKPGKPKGVLNPGAGAKNFQLSRFIPSPDLQYFLDHFWIVEWDMKEGETYCQEVLSYPSVHLVFERGNSKIYGVVTGKFARELSGAGKVIGIKFRPGAFYPFLQSPVAKISNRTLNLEEVFDIDTEALETELFAEDDREKMVEITGAFMRNLLPYKDEKIERINRIVDCIIAEKSLIRVDQITDRFDIGKRTLQRMFNRYVGVSPKWVIKRFRLHEAAAELAENSEIDWAGLALDLGYYDQAHFIKDFKSIVGQTPAEYVAGINSEQ